MTDVVGPVFVAGCPRSGTSALSWAVAAHPLYWTSVETHFFYYLLRETFLKDVHARSSEAGSWLNSHHVSHEEFLQHMGVGLDRMMRSRSGGLQWVDGSPENLLVGEELLTMFPNAQLLNVVRAPEPVCLSMLMSGFAEDWAADIDAAIRTWCHYAQTGLRLVRTCPDRVLQVRQEDMLQTPRTIAVRLGERLQLDVIDSIAAFLAAERVNSSFDRASFVDNSPFRDRMSQLTDPAEFRLRFAARIAEETTDLADALGYGP